MTKKSFLSKTNNIIVVGEVFSLIFTINLNIEKVLNLNYNLNK